MSCTNIPASLPPCDNAEQIDVINFIENHKKELSKDQKKLLKLMKKNISGFALYSHVVGFEKRPNQIQKCLHVFKFRFEHLGASGEITIQI